MKAIYTTKAEKTGVLEYPVIIPQAMQHGDGFTLIGFENWEDVNDEKLCAAVTNVTEFHISKENIGFK